MQIPHVLRFWTEKKVNSLVRRQHLSILRSKWNKIKFNVWNSAFNQRFFESARITVQEILKTLVRNATSAMF